MIFRDERDLRTFIRKAAGDRVFWIEPGKGGTVGMPDCFIGVDGRSAFVELKCGDIEEPYLAEQATWKNELRGSQKSCIRRLLAVKVPVVVLVARRGTTEIGWVNPAAAVLAPAMARLAWTRLDGYKQLIENIKESRFP